MPVTDPKFNPSGSRTVDRIKAASNVLAEEIEKLPSSRRRSVALTHLETAAMWAVKAAAVGDE